MNWEDLRNLYVDPGLVGGGLDSWGLRNTGQQPAYDPYEDIGAMPRHPQFDETKQSLPLEDTSLDFMDLFDPTMLGKAGKFLGRHVLEDMAGLGILGMTHRGMPSGWGSRFAGAEFGKKRTGPANMWELLGELESPHTISGEVVPHSVYRQLATGDRITVNPDNRVSMHMTLRDYNNYRQALDMPLDYSVPWRPTK